MLLSCDVNMSRLFELKRCSADAWSNEHSREVSLKAEETALTLPWSTKDGESGG